MLNWWLGGCKRDRKRNTVPQSECVRLGIEGSLVRDSPESLCDVLEQDT